MNIHELEEMTGQPARNIRFLIAEGIVPEPHGKARWASYGEEHVAALAFYGELKSQGVTSLSAIRERIARRFAEGEDTVISPLPGVEIRVASSVLRGADVDGLSEAIGRAVRSAVLSARKEV